jgi:hypothetical protein
MSQPSTLEPFDDQPLSPGAGGGCGKPVLIGCGVLVLAALIALVVLVVKAESLLEWSLSQYQEALVANLPEDVTPAERERLEIGFEAVLGSLRRGELDPKALPELQRVLIRTSARVERLERRDVLELIVALEKAAGLAAPVAEPAPSTTEPSDEPTAQNTAAA